jgi:hypothetical protein
MLPIISDGDDNELDNTEIAGISAIVATKK